MNFAPIGILLVMELIIAFLVAVGAISLACYTVVRVCYKAKSDALKKHPALEREEKNESTRRDLGRDPEKGRGIKKVISMKVKFKKKRLLKRRGISIVCVLSMTLFSVACQKAGEAESPSRNQYKRIEKATDTDYPQLSFNEMANSSDLVVAADFLGFTKPFKVSPYGGGDISIYRDAVFKVKKVYKGEMKEGRTVTVRIPGGDVVDDGRQTIYAEPTEADWMYNDENEKVLFLGRPRADRYKTREDYYKFVTGPNGMYDLRDNTLFGLFHEDVTIDAKALDSIDPTVDPAAEEKAEMDERLQEKSMTREEYDGYFESLEQYGTKEP